ncbi:MAG: hypothetical protein MUF48_12765 [Pirellulaceae bacterium]|jgi:hypothetical protein|nr:hypothetical protein [Pirellulaceae bacterium]
MTPQLGVFVVHDFKESDWLIAWATPQAIALGTGCWTYSATRTSTI